MDTIGHQDFADLGPVLFGNLYRTGSGNGSRHVRRANLELHGDKQRQLDSEL